MAELGWGETVQEALSACETFSEGWDHFLGCIKFEHTFLDARAIEWMNKISMKMRRIDEYGV